MLRKSWVLLTARLGVLVLAVCGGRAACQRAAQPARVRQEAPWRGNAANGEKLFNQATLGKDNLPGCKTCHSIVKDQKLVGPSLYGIATDAEGAFKEAGYKGTAKTAGGVAPRVDREPERRSASKGSRPTSCPRTSKTS